MIRLRARHGFAGLAGLGAAAAAEGHSWGLTACIIAGLAALDLIIRDALSGRR